ncbi:MAG: pyridoxine 5'-phosphate synthase [Candidatus Ratteibacteria bacterium]|nr:pyridoxine 5'-phosphate synthase [Candidatus Ratteibacteria bacterium]
MKLGVNIDHIATVRQARRGESPDPVYAACICELSGCASIVCHLREDRRHIQDRDLYLLKQVVKTRLNLEMALSEEIIRIALDVKPHQVTLVPEKREELTTEGGLDVVRNFDRIKDSAERFHKAGIKVSLFIEPDERQILAGKDTGAEFIELHTGRYADAKTEEDVATELEKISKATVYAISIGMRVNAGHGLDYHNTAPICKIKGIEELNIGYSIIGRAVFTGLERAVKEMLEIIKRESH